MYGLAKDKNILIYDGDCPFCNKSAIFLAKMDKDDLFFFVSNVSKEGTVLLQKHSMQKLTKKTLIVIVGGSPYIKTRAIYHFLKTIKKWKIIQILLQITPLFLSNFIYDFVAKHRLKIVQNTCPIPNDSIKHKFKI